MLGLSTVQVVVIGVAFAVGAAAGGLAARAWDGSVIADHAATIERQAEQIGTLEQDRDRETARADRLVLELGELRATYDETVRALDRHGDRDEQLRRDADQQRRRCDATSDDPGCLDSLFGVPGAGPAEAPRDGTGGARDLPGAAIPPARRP